MNPDEKIVSISPGSAIRDARTRRARTVVTLHPEARDPNEAGAPAPLLTIGDRRRPRCSAAGTCWRRRAWLTTSQTIPCHREPRKPPLRRVTPGGACPPTAARRAH